MGVELNLAYRIGGDEECEHPQLCHLGQMGLIEMFECDSCGAILTTSG